MIVLYRALLLYIGISCVFCLRSSSSMVRDPPKHQVNVGLILPHTNFGVREYTRARNSAVSSLHKSRGPRFKWLEKYAFTTNNIHNVLMLLTPSPTGCNIKFSIISFVKVNFYVSMSQLNVSGLCFVSEMELLK